MKKNLLLSFAALCFTFIIAEVGLRIAGIQPGMYIQSQWFTAVDSVFMKQGFYADSNGIFKVSASSRDSVISRINRAYIANTIPDYNGNYEISEVYCLAQEAVALNRGNITSAFNNYISELQAAKQLNEFDSAVLNYATFYPINKEGFRSISLKKYNTTKKKVLLIGDSFTWGHSANLTTNSFADLLLARGYIVYNTGISGADPAQYLAIAQKYIGILKPDYVVVNFFMGNDVLNQQNADGIKYFNRVVKPYVPIHYCTNAGNILSCPEGIYFNEPEKAYNFVAAQYKIPQNTFSNKVLSLTAWGTLLWKALNRFNLVSNVNNYKWHNEQTKLLLKDTPSCNAEIMQIDSICKFNNCKFILSVINDLQYPNMGGTDKYPHLFEGIKFYISPVKDDGYNRRDGHFNNEGHKQYADHIEKLIKEQQ